jgi:hypothetical protein
MAPNPATAASNMLFVRHIPVAGSGIRSPAALRSALSLLIASQRDRSFQTLSDVVVPLTGTRPPSSSHLRPLIHTQLRTISTAPNSQRTSDEMAEPTGLIAKSGIELLTFG